MKLPGVVEASGLFSRLHDDRELLQAVLTLRENAERLAETIARSIPSFTDHSIRHMDALWGVADRILTRDELKQLSAAEAFLLGTGFYLHDIGMAYAATAEGLARICSSPEYISFISAFPTLERSDTATIGRATALAVRRTHANTSRELAITPVPGTSDFYLMEPRKIREAWAETCGRVAASHHWSIEEVERELGSGGTVPLPGGREGDLGYVASVLRLIDYAHINRDRAPTIDRILRQPLAYDSLVHWLAQEQVDGPSRDGGDLIYRAATPIANVDAWWLYYEMLTGLDAEIRAVKRYLDRRSVSRGRLSLQGIRGAISPEEASIYIPTAGFLPIEVHLRTGSIDRLVKLLAGESLYGPDPMAAVRELIQNARDAVLLKTVVGTTALDRAALDIPIRVELTTAADKTALEVADWGIGMTRKVMTDYLLSIASDYWTGQFHVDFPTVPEGGFRPAGKFGIGFLSVFMLGDDVTVESNRDSGERCRLLLRGVERRGEIRTVPSPSGSGTSVRILLKKDVAESLRSLDDLARVYAPMLSHPLQVIINGQSITIPVDWWRTIPCKELHQWTLHAIELLHKNRQGRELGDERVRIQHDPMFWYKRDRGKGAACVDEWAEPWPEYSENKARFVAAPESKSLLCLMGLALQPVYTPGFVGVIDVDSVTPDVSRRQAIGADVGEIVRRAVKKIRPQIISQLNSHAEQGLLIDELGFIGRCVRLYGREPLLESSIRWINFLKMPGEVQLVNSAEFLAKLAQSRSLFLAYGTGPWTAMRRWVELRGETPLDEPATVVDDVDYPDPGYVDSREEKVGSLNVLWPNAESAPVFGTILRIVAEAWQVNLEVLTNQDGWRHSGSVVWGRLMRT